MAIISERGDITVDYTGEYWKNEINPPKYAFCLKIEDRQGDSVSGTYRDTFIREAKFIGIINPTTIDIKLEKTLYHTKHSRSLKGTASGNDAYKGKYEAKRITSYGDGTQPTETIEEGEFSLEKFDENKHSLAWIVQAIDDSDDNPKSCGAYGG